MIPAIINIYELDSLHGCSCTCFYDFTHEFTGLKPGSYTAKVWEVPYETYKLAGTTEFVIPVQRGSPSTTSSKGPCHWFPGVAEQEASYGIEFKNLSFSPAEIPFTMPEPTSVTVSIFDVAGRTVRTLTEGYKGSGEHALTWNSQDETGKFVPKGVYHVRLTIPKFSKTLSLVILR